MSLMLADDCRCLGLGCDQRDQCARYVERDSGTSARTPFALDLRTGASACDAFLLTTDSSSPGSAGPSPAGAPAGASSSSSASDQEL